MLLTSSTIAISAIETFQIRKHEKNAKEQRKEEESGESGVNLYGEKKKVKRVHAHVCLKGPTPRVSLYADVWTFQTEPGPWRNLTPMALSSST